MRACLVLLVVVTVAAASGCDAEKTHSMHELAEATAWASRGEYQSALRHLDEALSIDPANALAHYYQGLIRLQHYDDPNGALSPLERAVELDAANPDFHYQFGVALESLERVDQARAQFDETLRLRPDHAEALYRSAILRERAGEVRDAIDYYTRTIYANPRFPLAYSALGSLYFLYGRPQEAIQVFTNAVENNPDDWQNRADLGRVYLSLNDYPTAITYLRQASEIRSDSFALAYNLGAALHARWRQSGSPEDRAQAVEALQTAVNRCSQSERAMCDAAQAAIREIEEAAREP